MSSPVICQMCESEMPFKKRDDSYYFESVEAFDGIPIERHELFLALCPVCAATYQEFVKRDDANGDAFKDALANSTGTAIPMKIGIQQKTLRFVETHIFDLRTILNEPSSE